MPSTFRPRSEMTTSSHTTFVALLRGINVGGHKIIKMDALRAAFAGMGFGDVATYVQSGNVVFKSSARTSNDLAKKIEEMLLRRFSLSVPVIVRSAEEIGEVARSNPFLKESGIDPGKLHVTFLSGSPQKTALKGLDTIAAGPDRFHCCGQEIYLYCPNGFGVSKLSINVFEKVLSVGATTRNWNTVNRLWEMAKQP